MKKNKFKYPFYVLTLINALLLAGCTQTDKSTAFSVDIDGQKVYFDKGSKEDKEAQEIDKVISDYLNASVIADYTNYDCMAQFEYYLSHDKAALINNGSHLGMDEYVKSSQLISELTGYTLDEVYIYERDNAECAEVLCTYITTVISATDEYCESTKQDIGKFYKRSMRMKLRKEEGLWKISYELVRSEREEVTLENE